jgi:hypothetical protein
MDLEMENYLELGLKEIIVSSDGKIPINSD